MITHQDQKLANARHIAEILKSAPDCVVDATLGYLLEQTEAASEAARQSVEKYYDRCGRDRVESSTIGPIRNTTLVDSVDGTKTETVRTDLSDLGIDESDWKELDWCSRWEACQRLEMEHETRLGPSSDEIAPFVWGVID